MTTAAGAATPRRRLALKPFNPLRTAEMTVPAYAGAVNLRTPQDTLPFPQVPTPDAKRALSYALNLGISPAAYHVYAVMVLRIEWRRWVSAADIAEAAGVTEQKIRPHLVSLHDAGLLLRARQVTYNRKGVPSVRVRYALAEVAA
jgi:hypothetical protein